MHSTNPDSSRCTIMSQRGLLRSSSIRFPISIECCCTPKEEQRLKRASFSLPFFLYHPAPFFQFVFFSPSLCGFPRCLFFFLLVSLLGLLNYAATTRWSERAQLPQKINREQTGARTSFNGISFSGRRRRGRFFLDGKAETEILLGA